MIGLCVFSFAGKYLRSCMIYNTLTGETSDSQMSQMLEESVKMKDLNHPNILGLIGICIERGTAPYIVMPFMANGSLLAYLKQERNSLTIAIGAEQDLVSLASDNDLTCS